VIVPAARLANVGFTSPGATRRCRRNSCWVALLGYFLPNVSEHLFAKAAGIPVGIISQIGLILLMFQIGSDFEFGHLAQKRNQSAVMNIAAASIAVPLLLGGLIGWLSAPVLAPQVNRITYCSFLAVAMAITAVPTLGRILRELNLTRTRLGVLTITAAAINDVARLDSPSHYFRGSDVEILFLGYGSAVRRNWDLPSSHLVGRKTRGRLSVAPPTSC
jgi:hypothetical protein